MLQYKGGVHGHTTIVYLCNEKSMRNCEALNSVQRNICVHRVSMLASLATSTSLLLNVFLMCVRDLELCVK